VLLNFIYNFIKNSIYKVLELAYLEAEFQRSAWGRFEDEDGLKMLAKQTALSSSLLFARWNQK
jgi:hypothetical protein